MLNNDRWDKIVYKDEKQFNFDRPDGFQFYWYNLRKKLEKFWSRQNGDGGVMIWAGFSKKGKTSIYSFNGTLRSIDYVVLFNTAILPYLHATYEIKGYILQHANATIHAVLKQMIFDKE